MSFIGFTYAFFGWLGKILLKIFRGTRDDIKASGLKIYPEAYASLIGFIFIITLILNSILGVSLYVMNILKLLPKPVSEIFSSNPIIIAMLPFTVPLLVLFIGIKAPVVMKVSRTSRLNLEVPYLAAYISVMSTGGISPYTSFERLARASKELFAEVRKEARKFYLFVRGLGMDPLTAVELSAKEVPNQQYRQLMLGYAATLRAGGDVVHYLQRQTEIMFKDRISQVRAIAERIGILLEGYMAITVVLALTVYSIFLINRALAAAAVPMFGDVSFFMFGYIVLPLTSGIFIYLADIMQPKYPTSDNRPYYVFFSMTLPITVFLSITMFLPFVVPPPGSFTLKRIFSPIVNFVILICKKIGLPRGFESGIGLSLAMLIGLIPSIIMDIYVSSVYRGIHDGITRFLRDLVEVRKTGMAPEKCILNLSDRDYGKFSKYLKNMANQIGWGISLTRIYKDFEKKVKSWIARITMFLLVESIEVGGGTPQTLESLASFAEMIELVEKEKSRTLKPMIFIPYIGSIITTVVVLVLINFLNNIMSIAHMAIPVELLTSRFLPPIIVNSYFTGLTAGKISSEKVSAGFKHAFLLVLSTLIAMWVTPSVVIKIVF
ncbi:MAG TPA: hypothetical protein ENG40_01145 [Thermoprotei archaeon]|nr:hypothetical protein [Thermoprotei archaeon]